MICISKPRLVGGALAAILVPGLLTLAPPAHAEVVTPGSRMMLVLDSSGSMAEDVAGGGSKIEAARESLHTVTDALPEDQLVGLRVFGAEVFSADEPGACTDSQQVVAPATGNREDLHAAVDDYEPYGETPTGFALAEAGDDLGDEGQRTIVLVSDGEANCDPDPCEVAAELSEDGIDLRIDVVGLDVSGDAREMLRCIADKGNGTYYDADDTESLEDSLGRVAERSSRPFDLTGQPVEGSTDPAQAPVLGTGVYLDTIPASEELWYRVDRTSPGSTLHVGATFRYVVSNSNLYLDVYDAPDGQRCASTQVNRVLSFNKPLVRGATSTWQEEPDAPCNTADSVYVSLRSSTPELTGRPVELVTYEEPPLADPNGRDLPPAPDTPAWVSLEPATDPEDGVVTGTSLASAPVVADGSYALDINGGEIQVLAIPLDWGQDLQVQLDCVWPQDGFDVEVDVISPLRGRGNVDFNAREPEDWYTAALPNAGEGEEVRLGAQTLQTAFRHRSGDASETGASVAGMRYVQISFRAEGEEPINLPYTLTLQTGGTAGEGAPDYRSTPGLEAPGADFAITVGDVPGQGSEPTPEGSPSATPSAEPSGSAGPGGDSGPGTDPEDAGPDETGSTAGAPVLALVVGGAGLALLVAAGVVLLTRRRR